MDLRLHWMKSTVDVQLRLVVEAVVQPRRLVLKPMSQEIAYLIQSGQDFQRLWRK
jgi:hypothetical protein